MLNPTAPVHPSRALPTARATVVAAVASLLLLLGAVAAPAHASENDPTTYGQVSATSPSNVFYAYATAGETVSFAITQGTQGAANLDMVAAEPDGTTHPAAASGSWPATTNGVWTFTVNAAAEGYNWDVRVEDAGGIEIAGRVWASGYTMRQEFSPGAAALLEYWVVNDAGYVYRVGLHEYQGLWTSRIAANSVGYLAADCITPLYRSLEMGDVTTCPGDDAYKVFFEQPAADLPVDAPSAAGTMLVMPTPLTETDLAGSTLTFTPDIAVPSAGTFTIDIDRRFAGGFVLELDLDGDADFTDAVDRSIPLTASGSGTYSYAWDGLDGLGDPAAATSRAARLSFSTVGEVHFLQTDVEGRDGISVTRLTNPDATSTTLFWDDTALAPRARTTPVSDGTAGYDSSVPSGVHGWDYFQSGAYGDSRAIDDWAYYRIDAQTGDVSIGSGATPPTTPTVPTAPAATLPPTGSDALPALAGAAGVAAAGVLLLLVRRRVRAPRH